MNIINSANIKKYYAGVTGMDTLKIIDSFTLSVTQKKAS